MPHYHVHIYREMRLLFEGIETATPDEAARIAAEKLTREACLIDDCDGETIAALVDVRHGDLITIAGKATGIQLGLGL